MAHVELLPAGQSHIGFARPAGKGRGEKAEIAAAKCGGELFALARY